VRGLLRFPDPVNEKAARVVAGGVVLLGLLVLATGSRWLLVLLAYGFVARVLTGPTLSPLGQLASRAIAPRLGPATPVPGPPKRFAQGIGAVLSVAAAILLLGVGDRGAASVLVALIVVAASLESGLGYCVGCRVFALLMRLGVIPASVCAACSDLSLRRSRA
jgi:hypothetical protein